MDFELFIALFCVIGIGWLTLVPTYRGWRHLDRRMAEQVETTIAALDEGNADPSADGRCNGKP